MIATWIMLCLLVCALIGGTAVGVIGSVIVLDSMARHAPRHPSEHEHRTAAPESGGPPVARRR